MVSYFVRYRGQAADPRAFACYYENEHAQVLRRFSGIRALPILPISLLAGPIHSRCVRMAPSCWHN